MPFEVTDNVTGKTLVFENKPSDLDLEEAFGSLDTPTPLTSAQMTPVTTGQPKPEEQGIYEKYVKPIAYPVAEALGMAGGGIAGSVGGPAGTVAGAALGYGAVKEGEKIIENFIGIRKPKKITEELTSAGRNIAEGAALELGGQAIGKVGGYLLDRGGRKLYQSALKPGKGANVPLEAVDRRITTGLKENIPVSRGGYDKTNKIIRTINTEIDSRLNQLADDAVTIGRDAALKPVEEIIPKQIAKNITPAKNISTVTEYVDEIRKLQPNQIGIKQAQEFKKYLNKELNEYFKSVGGKIAPATAETEAKSAMTKGLRKEISDAFPEITAKNIREGNLIELNKSMANAVNRINNRELIPLLAGMAFGGGNLQQGFWKAVLFKVVDQPYVKSKLGIAMHKVYMKNSLEPTAKTIGVLLNQGNGESPKPIRLDANGNGQ